MSEMLSKFDDNGKRIITVVKGIHYKTDEERQQYISDGFVVTSEEDWNYYIGNHGKGRNGTGYIRDPETGKPVDAPAYVPTKDKQAQTLYNACQSDLRQIDAQIVKAVAIGDDKLVADLRQERAERIEQYQRDLAELEGGDE